MLLQKNHGRTQWGYHRDMGKNETEGSS